MANIATFVIVMSGLLLLFHIGGVIEPTTTPNGLLILLLTNPEDLVSSSLFSQIIIALESIALIGGIILGFVNRNVESIARAVFAIFILNLFVDFFRVYTVIASINLVIGVLLFAPIMVYFVINIIDWWGKFA